jgi:PIN domain nuclease of toxin-antitoxin system
MTGVLLDTHAWAWTIYATDRLSPEARTAVTRADVIMVSPVSLFEIGQKVRAGKWPEVEPILDRLPEILREQGAFSAALTPEICLAASTMDWPHRDPFDRIIAATAEILGLALVTRDAVFATRPGLRTIW